MYLNRVDRGTHPFKPGVTTVRSAFRQELEIPLSVSPDSQVALFSMYYTHSFSNAVLKLPTNFHCEMGYQQTGQPTIVERSIQLSCHQQFTHVSQVLQDLVQQLGLIVMPTLSGGKYHYGQLHEDLLSSYYQDFPTNPKLHSFCHDLVDGCLANHTTLPITYLEIKTYLNQHTTTLMSVDNVKYIWTLMTSPSKPDRYYSINLLAEAFYNLDESLALFMGFLKYYGMGETHIVAHNDVWVDTANNMRTRFKVH